MRTNESRKSLQRTKKRRDEIRHRQMLSRRDGPSAPNLTEVDPLTGAAPYRWASLLKKLDLSVHFLAKSSPRGKHCGQQQSLQCGCTTKRTGQFISPTSYFHFAAGHCSRLKSNDLTHYIPASASSDAFKASLRRLTRSFCLSLSSPLRNFFFKP